MIKNPFPARLLLLLAVLFKDLLIVMFLNSYIAKKR